MRFFVSLFALALLPAISQAQSVEGSIFFSQTDNVDELLIEGPAAEALLDSLVKRPGALEITCGPEVHVLAGNALCSRGEETRCWVHLSPDRDLEMTPPDCEKPDPSIIGVGNVKLKRNDGRPDVKTGLNERNWKFNEERKFPRTKVDDTRLPGIRLPSIR